MPSEYHQSDEVKPPTEASPATTNEQPAATSPELKRTAETLRHEITTGTRKPQHALIELASVGLSDITTQENQPNSAELPLDVLSQQENGTIANAQTEPSQETATSSNAQTAEQTQAPEAAPLQKHVREQLKFLHDHYGVPIYMGRLSERDKRFHGTDMIPLTDIEKLTLPEAQQALETLTQAMTMYPPDYIKAVGLKGIRLVKSMQEMKQYSMEDILEGKVQDERGTSLGYSLPDGYIYLTTNTLEYPIDLIFHHELRHIDDFSSAKNPTHEKKTVSLHLRNLRDKLMRKNNGLQDTQWDKLTPSNKTAYLDVREFLREIPGEALHQETEGFAVNYGRLARPEGRSLEDKATVAQCLFMEPQRMAQRSETDRVLAAKMAEIKRRFRERSNGKMNEQYFTNLANGSITKDYWSSQNTTVAA
jgi:hypothetical protein